jgi:hypothetical protein
MPIRFEAGSYSGPIPGPGDLMPLYDEDEEEETDNEWSDDYEDPYEDSYYNPTIDEMHTHGRY